MEKRYLYTTPELRAQRQAQIARLVEREYGVRGGTGPQAPSIDQRAEGPVALGAAGVFAATAVGVAYAAYMNLSPPPPAVPTAGPGLTNNGAPVTEVVIPEGDQVGNIAAAAAKGAYARQDGKKLDTFERGTPGYRFQDPQRLGRPFADQFGRGRTDNFARIDRGGEGRVINGRGPDGLFRAPAIPTTMKNFDPVK